MTRNEAIEIMNKTVSGAVMTTGDVSEEEKAYLDGAQDLLTALASAGAFEDGRNMHDRLPHAPPRQKGGPCGS